MGGLYKEMYFIVGISKAVTNGRDRGAAAGTGITLSVAMSFTINFP